MDLSKVVSFASMLFVPGTRPERFQKALASGADMVCIDLEDAVPQADKAAARTAALQALDSQMEGRERLALRINGVVTRAGLEDLVALADAPTPPALLFVPKVESAAEIAVIRGALGERTPGIVPLIESVRGMDAIREIAAAPGVAAMMFGGGDFAGELGVELSWEPLATARGLFVMACAGAGLAAIDVPYIALDDQDGLSAEAEAAKRLGFTAKAAIHPAQVAVINSIFRPTSAELAEARAAEEAFRAAGGAAVRFNGRMLEAPIMRRYQRILAMGSNQDA